MSLLSSCPSFIEQTNFILSSESHQRVSGEPPESYGESSESLKSWFIFISKTFSLALATERLSVLFVKIQEHLKHLKIFTWDGQPGLVLVANGVDWMT